MAAGDFTISANTLNLAGNTQTVSGTVEVDGTLRAFDLLPHGYIVPGTFTVTGFDDAGSVQVRENEDADGNADNGSVAMDSTTEDVNTYRWSCNAIL